MAKSIAAAACSLHLTATMMMSALRFAITMVEWNVYSMYSIVFIYRFAMVVYFCMNLEYMGPDTTA